MQQSRMATEDDWNISGSEDEGDAQFGGRISLKENQGNNFISLACNYCAVAYQNYDKLFLQSVVHASFAEKVALVSISNVER